MKQCPKCDVDMKVRQVGPVEIDECRTCRGIWFDKDELRQVKDATDSDLNWMDFEIWKHEDQFQAKDSALTCPTCRTATVSLEYGKTKVEIDYCPSCRGTWLDRGELRRMIEALHDELVDKSFSEYVRESLREAAEIVIGPESFISEWKDFATVLRLMQSRLFVEKPNLLKALTTAQKANPLP